jgi:hypothetical protein
VALACSLTFCWGCHDSSWPFSLGGTEQDWIIIPVHISHRSNLGGLEWNLQIGGIARGLGAWQVLVLNQFQLLSAAVTVIFFSTLDWMANGGGIEALLLGYCGHLLSCKYRESGSHKSSYLWDSWFSGRDRTLGNCHPRS